MRTPVLLNWKANNTFGWGIAGLNIFFHWASDPEVQPLMYQEIGPGDIQMIDPMRLAAVSGAIATSNAFVREFVGKYTAFDFPMIDALGNGFAPPNTMTASKTIARTVFEDTRMEDLDTKLAKYDCLLCASTWNRDLLASVVRKPIAVIHEGIDPSLFFPGPRSNLLPKDRFYVFTGGKVEFRKAQDLVLLAFREFSARHPDAVLVTSWHSPWPAYSAGVKGKADVELKLAADGRIDVIRWAVENGIRKEAVIDIGPIPNPLMPHVLREMDCALQPSRAEGGTNFVCKEAMACGVPVILGANSGVCDLVGEDNCMPLRRQGPVVSPVPNEKTDGWGESDVEEMVHALEQLYTDRELRKRISAKGAAWILDHGRTWQVHAEKLRKLCLDR